MAATWFSGVRSGLLVGFAASQNLIEAFNALLRRVTKRVGHHQSVVELMEQLGLKFRRMSRTPGHVFSMPGLTRTGDMVPPLPFEAPSRDLVVGPNRKIHTGGYVLLLPTVLEVVSHFQTTKGKLQMTFDKFNVEYASNCKKKDYLFVGSLAKYTSVSENL